MHFRDFKPFTKVSALTLGGGGIGQVWGETTKKESIKTVHCALDQGINHFDVAPMYGKGEAERVVGESLSGMNKDNLFFTTKCQLGTLPDNQVYERLNASLVQSLKRLELEKVDLFLLHSQLIEDEFKLFKFNEFKEKSATTISCFFDSVIPAFERLQKEGKIDHWGIGGLGQEEAILKALDHSKPPSAVQCVINPLNSAGAIGYVSEDFNPSLVLSACQEHQIPILAIRAVQAGALTSLMDRLPLSSGFDQSDFDDFKKAQPFRDLASIWNESPASLAHRYALSMQGVSSVILGVKNKKELIECIDAEERGTLSKVEIQQIENCIKES
jgi:aryl-alcohol dehydrogenase-like predicted oxidoreductase